MKESVLIIGGSGLVGRHLSFLLKKNSYEVSILSRSKSKNPDQKSYTYDYQNDFIEIEALTSADYIINLAGANVGANRWTKNEKENIYNSRVKQTDFIHHKIKENNIKPKAFISASASGYYGLKTSDKIYTENDQAGTDFLAKVCHDWEEKVLQFEEENIRTLILRIGVVLSRNGGALQKMLLPAKFGLLSPIGNGKQYMPWIHIDDLCRMFLFAIQNEKTQGIYNAVSNDHIDNISFTKSLLKIFKKKVLFPSIPAFVLKFILGEKANLLLYGSRVSSDKISNQGFEFSYPDLDTALKNIFN